MYTIHSNVNILTSLLVKYGITKAVVCPGSRNSPIVHNLDLCPGIECFPVTDERSAGFFALGMILDSNEPVVVCVTSGSALLNVAPAVAEAYYQNQPLIVISADRPAQWIDMSDGQTIRQNGALEPHVQMSVNVPQPHNEEEHWHCNRLINEALNAAIAHDGGPVHINVPISDPLFDYSVDRLPDERRIILHDSVTNPEAIYDLAQDFCEAKRPMLVIGQLPTSVVGDFIEPIEQIGRIAPVLREKLADDNICPSVPFDEVLAGLTNPDDYRPDFILYMGGTLVSKRLKKFLRDCHPSRSVVVDGRGAHRDTFMHLTDVVEGHPTDMIEALAEEAEGKEPTTFAQRWQEALDEARDKSQSFLPHYSQMLAVKRFHEMMREGDVDGELFYGNSTAVRLGNIYSGQYIYVNRGVNGIEGTLSTAVGYAVSCKDSEDVFCVIGDLSFFYDQNALWNQNLDSNLSILLLNNGGGGIFNQLSGLEASGSRDRLVAAAHSTSAKGICEENDIVYLSANNAQELNEGLHAMFESDEGPVLLEVFTDAEEDARVMKEYWNLFARATDKK